MTDKWNIRDFPWVRDLPEPMRTEMAHAAQRQGARAEEYLKSILPSLARLDAETVVFVTLTRLSVGMEPHPDIAFAAFKLLNEVIALREKLQAYETKPIDT
jgi:hypothetical protein